MKYVTEIRRENLCIVDTEVGYSFLRGCLAFYRSEFVRFGIGIALPRLHAFRLELLQP